MASVFTAFINQIANLQTVQRETTAALQNSINGGGHCFWASAALHRLSLTRHRFLSESSNLHTPRLQ